MGISVQLLLSSLYIVKRPKVVFKRHSPFLFFVANEGKYFSLSQLVASSYKFYLAAIRRPDPAYQ